MLPGQVVDAMVVSRGARVAVSVPLVLLAVAWLRVDGTGRLPEPLPPATLLPVRRGGAATRATRTREAPATAGGFRLHVDDDDHDSRSVVAVCRRLSAVVVVPLARVRASCVAAAPGRRRRPRLLARSSHYPGVYSQPASRRASCDDDGRHASSCLLCQEQVVSRASTGVLLVLDVVTNATSARNARRRRQGLCFFELRMSAPSRRRQPGRLDVLGRKQITFFLRLASYFFFSFSYFFFFFFALLRSQSMTRSVDRLRRVLLAITPVRREVLLFFLTWVPVVIPFELVTEYDSRKTSSVQAVDTRSESVCFFSSFLFFFAGIPPVFAFA